MSLFDKAPSPDDERYPKWLAQRAPILTLLTAVAVWAVLHLFGSSILLVELLTAGGLSMMIPSRVARMRQTSPEAKEAARLLPGMAGWGRMDRFIARSVWVYPTSAMILQMLIGGFLTLMTASMAIGGFALMAFTNDLPDGLGPCVAALVLAVLFGLGTAAIARGLLLRRRARRHAPPGTEPLPPP